MSWTASLASDTPFFRGLRQGYLRCLDQIALAPAETSLLLAVSGGADSMALLHGTRQLFAEHAISCRVAHVHHGLRGIDSDLDAEFVESTCARWNIPCCVLRADVVTQHSLAPGESLEETARRVRYELLAEAADTYRIPLVVTAHHRSDQAETILHNVLRGTGLRGLQGMPRSRSLTSDTWLIRPLLEFHQNELRDFLSHGAWPFREDASNRDPEFTRNRIRLELLPWLQRDFNLRADQHLISLGHQAAQAVECLDQLANRLLIDALLEQTPESCRLNRTRLAEWPEFLLQHAFTTLWAQQNWPRRQMTTSHWELLSQAALTASPAARSLPGGIQLAVRDTLLHICQKTRKGR